MAVMRLVVRGSCRADRCAVHGHLPCPLMKSLWQGWACVRVRETGPALGAKFRLERFPAEGIPC
jgi:hypothetical protein